MSCAKFPLEREITQLEASSLSRVDLPLKRSRKGDGDGMRSEASEDVRGTGTDGG